MRPSLPFIMAVCGLLALNCPAQVDKELLASQVQSAASVESPSAEEAEISEYEPLNHTLGGDSIRLCNGQACEGWVEDHWPNGRLKHRGYYLSGRLSIYKNHFDNGAVEREFKVLNGVRSQLRTFHANGVLRSDALYLDGAAWRYEDHYPNGQLRYQEERDRNEPYYVVMDLFLPDGTPVSTLHLVDKQRVIFEQKEYHSNGQLAASGRAQFDPTVHDSKRIGTWIYYSEQGTPTHEEVYVEGKIHAKREL